MPERLTSPVSCSFLPHGFEAPVSPGDARSSCRTDSQRLLSSILNGVFDSYEETRAALTEGDPGLPYSNISMARILHNQGYEVVELGNEPVQDTIEALEETVLESDEEILEGFDDDELEALWGIGTFSDWANRARNAYRKIIRDAQYLYSGQTERAEYREGQLNSESIKLLLNEGFIVFLEHEYGDDGGEPHVSVITGYGGDNTDGYFEHFLFAMEESEGQTPQLFFNPQEPFEITELFGVKPIK